jgi:hypothetical protein
MESLPDAATRPPQRIAIVTPVLDDWEPLAQLVGDILENAAQAGVTFHMFVVDDGSASKLDPASLPLTLTGCIARMDVITLGLNLGHQRAIAVGLVTVAVRDDIHAVVVMDSDGEDRPSDIVRLLAVARDRPQTVVLAGRARRTESSRFRAGYAAYKLLFRLMVGRQISFGNFCVLPIAAVRRLVYMPELWNNLPAAVLRSRLPHVMVPTERGWRYSGASKMNLVSLVVHGLSAISVYVDTIFVRVLLVSAVFAALTIMGIVAAVVIRLFTALAIPGWTTTAVGALLILLVQTIVLVVATTLMSLSGRSARPIVPRNDCATFISRIETVWEKPLLAAAKSIIA